VSSEASTRPPRGGGPSEASAGVSLPPRGGHGGCHPLSNLERALARERSGRITINTPSFMVIVTFTMPRYYQNRKRSGGPIRRPFKKARFNRRRTFKKRATRSTNFTSQSSHGGGIQFRKTRFRPRRLRNILWNASTPQTHYRSNVASVATQSSPASAASMSSSLYSTRRFAGNNFWVTLGGAINPDGGAMPAFSTNSDITIRGGTYGIRVANNPDLSDVDKDALNVFVYLIWTAKGFSSANVPTLVNVGWDPSLIQDFQTNIGKIVMRKNFLLPEGETMTIERRMPIQKIDQTEYAGNISEPIWLVLVGNTGTSSAHAMFVTTYYNLSFVGDTV